MFNIGSVVVLKSNPEIKMTVCSEISKRDNKVTCVYINKNQKLEKQSLPVDCLELFKENLKEIELQKIPFLYCKAKDCYSFFEYASIYGASVHERTEESLSKNDSTRFVFDFKKYHKHKQHVYNLVTMAASYLGCEQIVCIPGHTTELNSLQKTFGVAIERTYEIEPRKYNHKKELCEGYEKSYSIDYTKIQNSILLVDDVLTSGATMQHFRDVFETKGFSVSCVSIGIGHKLDFETVNHFWLFE